MKKFIEKHIVKHGSRQHVLFWDNLGTHCSEKNCEINVMNKKNQKKTILEKILENIQP